MSTIDTTEVKDNDKVVLRNLTKHPVIYVTPATNVRREIPALGRITVPAGEVRECSYSNGCTNILREYVQVCNPELARELGVPDDMPEYLWGDKEVTEAVTTSPIDVLLDACDFGPAGIKEALADKAIELEIADIRRREAISKATGIDISKVIENKHLAEQVEEKEEKPKATRRRSSNSTSTRSRRVKQEE